jgi:hypothetical protein
MQTRQLVLRRGALIRLLAIFGVVGLTAGCNPTGVSTDSTGSIFRITADIADSSKYPAGSILSVPIHVLNDGVLVTSAPVHWVVLSGQGKVSDTVSTTDSVGTAHVLWTLGTTAGQNALMSVYGDASDTLYVIATIGAPSYIDAVGARSDTVSVGAAVSLGVIVRDRPGNAVPGVAVNWSSSGGGLSSSRTVSDGTGTATTSFVASAPGTYSVTADLPDLASLFFQVVVR